MIRDIMKSVIAICERERILVQKAFADFQCFSFVA